MAIVNSHIYIYSIRFIDFETDQFQFVELIKSALLYGASPVCVLRETEHPGHLNVRGVLRHCVVSVKPPRGLRSGAAA